ncbi:MAG: hypothetical protein KDE50_04580, partial [Caldilineaceae bacterium]|nr:hypothetical protein [Caldilineaceae bacterium]
IICLPCCRQSDVALKMGVSHIFSANTTKLTGFSSSLPPCAQYKRSKATNSGMAILSTLGAPMAVRICSYSVLRKMNNEKMLKFQ